MLDYGGFSFVCLLLFRHFFGNSISSSAALMGFTDVPRCEETKKFVFFLRNHRLRCHGLMEEVRAA